MYQIEILDHLGVSSDEANDEMRDIEVRLTNLMDRAPSDASGSLVIRRASSGYKGLLRIRSRHQSFVASGQSSNLFALIEELIAEVEVQVEFWQKHRSLGSEVTSPA